jgi:hypothetical protein
MLSVIYSTAFYGFLRCGEFTVSNVHNVYLLFKDVTFSEDRASFQLLLRSSKTDPFSQGVPVTIFNTNPLKPVSLMHRYLTQRANQGAIPTSPLFPESELSVLPLTRSTFISLLKQSLLKVGYSDHQYSGHSFRIGACTSGAAGGVQDHVLQVLGRWKSSCYSRYIRTQKSTLLKAQELMNHT